MSLVFHGHCEGILVNKTLFFLPRFRFTYYEPTYLGTTNPKVCHTALAQLDPCLIHDSGVSLFCGMEASHNALSTEHIGDNEYLFPHVVWGLFWPGKSCCIHVRH